MMDETLDKHRNRRRSRGCGAAGDAERYRELVERHERRVFAVARSRLGDTTLAEEATQEAFIRGYRRLWLLGMARSFPAGSLPSPATSPSISACAIAVS